MKKILRHPLTQSALATLIVGYIWLLRLTCRFKVEGLEHPKAFWEKGQPIIVALWHGRLLLTPALFARSYCPDDVQVDALISDHADGRLIARVAQGCGLHVITGSSSKGGAKAARTMIQQAQKGHSLLITPDGPRGPRMHLAPGVTEVAKLTGLPVVPATISASAGILFKSWDCFLMPRPFSRILIQWGEPVVLTKKMDAALRAQKKSHLEKAMVTAQMEGDKTIGNPEVVEPANIPKEFVE